jgi:bacteriocin-like protein
MTREIHQVELTDQELEQVIGGGGIGGASVGTTASTGGTGAGASVQATGVASGTIGIATGIGVAQSSQIHGPGNLGVQTSTAVGAAVGAAVS